MSVFTYSRPKLTASAHVQLRRLTPGFLGHGHTFEKRYPLAVPMGVAVSVSGAPPRYQIITIRPYQDLLKQNIVQAVDGHAAYFPETVLAIETLGCPLQG